MPTVSVIIPNYNHARFLRQRLESILAQSYQDFELILLDDASSDDSRRILQQYAAADPRIRTCFNERNSGSPFAQWNRGVGLASGRYIWIAESDDYADSAFLQTLVPVLEADARVGLVYCRSMQVDEQDRPLGFVDAWIGKRKIRHIDATRWQSSFRSNGREECRRYLCFLNSIPNASAVLFRRELFERVGGADTSYRLAGDWWLWVRMLQDADLAHVGQGLNYYRTHQRSVRQSANTNGRVVLEEYRIMASMRRRGYIDPTLVETVRESVASRWIAMALTHGRLPWMRNLQILRLACGLDPAILRRWLCALRDHQQRQRQQKRQRQQGGVTHG